MYATGYGLADDYHVESIWALVLLLFEGVNINYAGDEILWIKEMIVLGRTSSATRQELGKGCIVTI